MTYQETLEYIKEKEKIGSVFGLDSIKELLKRLGNPERGIPAIHIAGTNGKGSILSYVEEVLVEAGLRVGRYISPTIFDYRERWRFNKEWATEADVAEEVTLVASKVDEMIADSLDSPTAFEIETAVTFLLFRKWNVDVMLVECGMGGLLDATNVIEDNVINVMASVSMDHMQILGDTVQEITGQKLGIVRSGTILVSYPQVSEADEIIKKYCNDNNVRLIASDTEQLEIIRESLDGSSFIYKGREYSISIGGAYQIMNTITAIDVLDAFYDEFVTGTESRPSFEDLKDSDCFYEYVRKGMESAGWEGRFSVFSGEPYIIVDGAHNRDAWLRLRDSLGKLVPNKRFIYIIGVLKDNEYNKMIDILGPTAKSVICVESDSPRALSADELSSGFSQAGVSAESFRRDYDGALKKAIDMAIKKDTFVVICGTLSITGEMIKCIESIR